MSSRYFQINTDCFHILTTCIIFCTSHYITSASFPHSFLFSLFICLEGMTRFSHHCIQLSTWHVIILSWEKEETSMAMTPSQCPDWKPIANLWSELNSTWTFWNYYENFRKEECFFYYYYSFKISIYVQNSLKS